MASTENAGADFHSELNLFEQPQYQTSLTGEYEWDTFPIAALPGPGTGGSPIEFHIRGSDNTFFDLNNSKLEIKLHVTKADGSDTAAKDVSHANLLLHSIFTSVEMEVGGKLVTDPNTLYPYRAYLETIINMPKETLTTRLICEGWNKDTAGKLNINDPEGSANNALDARGHTLEAKATRVLIGRPHLDLFHQEKLIPPNVDIKLRFYPSKPEFVLIAKAATEAYKYVITSARFYVRAKTVSPSLILAHAHLLKETNYRIGYNKVSAKVITIPNGVSNLEHDNLYTGTLPDHIVMAFVANANMSGAYTSNPFEIENANLTYLGLKVNGELVPRIPLTPDFPKKDYIREYLKTLEALNMDIGPSCWDLTPEEWATGFTVWAFKITPGPIGTVRSVPRTGSIRLEARFGGTGTTKILNLILLSQRPAEIQFDQYKNVMLNE